MSIRTKQALGLIVLWGEFCLALSATAPPLGWAQESIRNVEEPGTFKKYLTPSTVDRWIFSGQQGELVVASVRTSEFDAILKLVQVVGEAEQLLLEIDDTGSNAQFATRLPADGQYKVLVHGYESKGGGNYSLTLEQFPVAKATIDQPATGTLNERGTCWLYFAADQDTFVYANILGSGGTRFQIRDPQGVPVPVWAGLAPLEKTGEYYVRVDGAIGRPFELRLHRAQRGPLAVGTDGSETLGPKSAVVLDLPVDGPSFGVLELEITGDLTAQVVPAAILPSSPDIRTAQPRRGLKFLEIPSKGAFRRYAMMREGGRDDHAPHQLRMVSERGASVRIRYTDPRHDLTSKAFHDGVLAVGGVHYFHLPAEQGRAVTLACTSPHFDSELRLYDATGQLIAADDDGGGGLDAKLRHLPFQTADLIVAVTSRGYGGGGAYQLKTAQEEPRPLTVGQRIRGKLGAGEVGFYSLAASAGQKTLFHLQSEVASAQIQILNAQGVEVQSTGSQQERDVVLVHEFLAEGDYAVLITLPQEGTFQLRAIDGQ